MHRFTETSAMRNVLTVVAGAWLGAAALAPAQTPRDKIAAVIAPILAKPSEDGLLVFDVLPMLQAEKAGFKIGDVITHYDGKPVHTTGHLRRFAQEAASENRSNILVVAMRNGQRLESEFQAAPMGVQLVPISKSQPRNLWRTATQNDFDADAVVRMAAKKHRWELVYHGENVVGWAHTYFADVGDRLVMRMQSYSKMNEGADRRDLVVSFKPGKPFPEVRSIRLAMNEKLLLDVSGEGGVLQGERAGVKEKTKLPADVLHQDLAGLFACGMPRKAQACVRCSYLESGSLVPAPFADVYCLGRDSVKGHKETVAATRFDHTVFGQSVANYWVDDSGDLVQIGYPGGFRIVRTTSTQVALSFPSALADFKPIEKLPALAP
ncbi:MAG TPA: PDZ domain-containing protein, partial [Planctomycetia bacterium]|nr:PDZ domain-containing protein [Planctomycetia bacterium]